MQKSHKSLLVKPRSFMLALAATILAALASVTAPVDRLIEIGIGHLAWRPVSGDIIVVGIDDEKVAAATRDNEIVPFHANLIQQIDKAGASRLFLDYLYDNRVNDPSFGQLTSVIQQMKNRVVLAVASDNYTGNTAKIPAWPSEKFGPDATRACICWEYKAWQVWDIPLSVYAEGKILPTFASLLANRPLEIPQRFAIDYSYDTETIPSYSYQDVLNGNVRPEQIAGKDVILAPLGKASSDRHYLPGHDLVPGAYIHLIAGETLRRGHPTDLSWPLPLGIAIACIAYALLRQRTGKYLLLTIAIIASAMVTKVVLSNALINIDIGPATLLLAIMAYQVARARNRLSAQHQNPVTGLPNFNAMRALPSFGADTVITAQIVHFDQLLTYLPQASSTQVIEQIARRLEIATTGARLYHDSDGSFAWLANANTVPDIAGQLSGLSALFNAPITVDDRRIDVKIAFGVNDEQGESNAQRLAAARGAADRAVRNRSMVEHYAGSQHDDAAWKLSFHSQLSDAMAAGDIWVAFQPQYNIRSGKLCGLEALARWTHPERGMIPPDQFIVQAEQSQDIYRLTLFVMDRAIQSASELQSLGHDLSISVNLSAALLDREDLASTIRVMLLAHNLEPSKLTIEITETAQFEESSRALDTLAQMRQLGIQLSIDDYGTGQSNLEYLIRIEADEIKIDKRFVKTMRDSQRNFEIVKSTIDLAHRLGAVAVAEGIEDQATLALLEKLGCDLAQGYHLGKPQLFFEIVASLNDTQSSKIA